jgi:hypothetical protein
MKAANKIFACCLLFACTYPAFPQTWTQTMAPTTNMWWSAIACSADGTKVIAASGVSLYGNAPTGSIYISTNSGDTWMLTMAPSNRWSSVASSEDGTRIVAVAGGTSTGPVYTSPDGGNTWISNKVPRSPWNSVASSADGSRLIAATLAHQIFISTNSGADWYSNTAPGAATTVASSADGLKLAVGGPDICTSTNGGQTWVTNVFSGTSFLSICSSADGTKLAAANGNGGPGYIYTSSDSGTTWTKNTNVPALTWRSIASSTDGTKLIASAWYSSGQAFGPVYTSSDSGLTWISNNLQQINWMGVASSADGYRHFALGTVSSTNGQVWVSQSTPAPHLNILAADTNVLLSWIVPSTNFTLQQSADLIPANWTAVTDAPVLNPTNVQLGVSLPQTNLHSFYRLTSP